MSYPPGRVPERVPVSCNHPNQTFDEDRTTRVPLESGQPFRIIGKRVGQDLNRHVAIQFGVARAVDLAHVTLADRRQDFIPTDAPTRGESHRLVNLEFQVSDFKSQHSS